MLSPRPFTTTELKTLARLWPTQVTDKALVEQFGRHRGVIYRAAREHLNLPTRRVARAEAAKKIMETP